LILAGAVLLNISPIAAHNTTIYKECEAYANDPVPGNQSVAANFLVFLAEFFGISGQNFFSLAQDCWRMLRKISCIMHCNAKYGGQDSPC